MTNNCNKKSQTGSQIGRRKEFCLNRYYWYLLTYLLAKVGVSRQRQEAGKTKVNTVHKLKVTECYTEKSRDVPEGLPSVFSKILISTCIGENYPTVGRESAKRIIKKNAWSHTRQEIMHAPSAKMESFPIHGELVTLEGLPF